MVVTERIVPNITQQPLDKKEFTPADQPHGDLGKGFASVIQKLILAPGALGPLQKENGDFTENQEVFVEGSFHRVTSIYDLLDILQLSVSAGFSGTGGGASASLDFARSLHITEENFYIAARLRVGKSKQTINSATYTADSVKKPPEAFLRAFGDQYCSTIHWGGELIVVYTLFSRSRLEQESLDVRLSAHYGGGSTAAQLSHKITTLNKLSTLDISLGVWGLADKIELAPQEIEKFITEFPTRVLDRGYVTQREFSEYFNVAGAPPDFKVPDVSSNEEKLVDAGNLIKSIDTKMRELHFRIKYPFLFETFDTSDLVKRSDTLDEKRLEIENFASRLVKRWWDLEPRLPNVNLKEIVGNLPAQIPNRKLPLIVKIGTRSNEYTAGPGEIVTAPNPKEQIQSIYVQFADAALQSSSSPVKIYYRAGLVYDNELDVEVNQMTIYYPGDYSRTFPDSAFHSFAFKLDGPDADYFDISYEVVMSNSKTPQRGKNDQPIGLPVGPTGGLAPHDAPDVRGIKVEVTARM